MKKKYLTYAGIVSAIILVVMFALILLTGSFSVFSSVTIDPIPDHAAGDLMVITGTTNIMAGRTLELDVVNLSSAPGTNSRVGETDAFIVRGGGLSNTWSGALDTSAIPPGEYQVNAYSVNDTGSRIALLATSQLTLTGTTPTLTESPGTVVNQTPFITVNPPGTISLGEKLLVTGTTNLPENTELLYLVIQQSNASVLTVNPNTQEQDLKGGVTRSGVIPVLPGIGDINRWSFAVDSTEFIPDQYQVIVTLENISVENIGKEGPFGTAPLVVEEAILNNSTTSIPESSLCQAITIDSFPAQLTNRSYTITGTTSLPAGTDLLFEVFPTEFDVNVNMGTPGMSGSSVGASDDVEVVRGAGNTNLWSADVDLSKFPPNEYLINISNDRIDNRTYARIYGDIYCSERFTLSG
ncbi:MAG: hypothetical protein WAU64_00210 [Methanoregula sp.]|uniref:hypothetical protein n=1 Tax=Methanoregula sp. TaxID=2052170 RepID=UPI003BAFDFE7